MQTENKSTTPQTNISSSEFIERITDKISKAENILVALSRNPSVDEIASAIGLTLFLEELGKHTTAIIRAIRQTLCNF